MHILEENNYLAEHFLHLYLLLMVLNLYEMRCSTVEELTFINIADTATETK